MKNRITAVHQRAGRHRGHSCNGRHRVVSASPHIECLEARSLLAWVPVASLPMPRFGLAATTGSDGLIYALGGTDGGGNALATVAAYRTSNNTWSSLAGLI